MKVSVDELVDRVKANMEELTDSFDADIVMTAGIGVERYIREKMPECLACRMGNGTGIVIAFDRLRFVVAATAFVRR